MSDVDDAEKIEDDFDSPWKAMIDGHFPQLIETVNPDLYRRVDWKSGFETLDVALSLPKPEGGTDLRLVDKLVRVRLLDGKHRLLLVHFEVQGQGRKDFEERFFLYWVRIREEHGEYPLSIALLIDPVAKWRPGHFEVSVGPGEWTNRMKFEYPVVKLLDFEARRAEFEASSNPFAWFILAHLDTLRTKNQYDLRASSKLSLAKAILKRMPIGQARDIIRMIDWLMRLPPRIEKRWYNDFAAHMKENKMPFVSIFEEMGIEKGYDRGFRYGVKKGIEEGIEKGIEKGEKQGRIKELLETLALPLDMKFGQQGLDFLTAIGNLDDLEKLHAIRDRLRSAQSIDELRRLAN